MDFDIVNKKIVMLGRTNSGKSYLARYLLHQYKDSFKKIYLFSPTEGITNFYKDLIEPKNIFEKYNDAFIGSLLNKITNLVKEGKDIYDICIILDDCGEEELNKSKNFIRLYTIGRHMKITTIFCSQYLSQIPKRARAQISFLIVGQQNPMSKIILQEEFNFTDLPPKEFLSLYNKSITDYNFLLINCNSVKNTEDLNEVLGIIKTPPDYL